MLACTAGVFACFHYVLSLDTLLKYVFELKFELTSVCKQIHTHTYPYTHTNTHSRNHSKHTVKCGKTLTDRENT
jgi:hypothetical protein